MYKPLEYLHSLVTDCHKYNPHSVTAAQIGLGNVNNTADSAKSVKYASTAGSAGNTTTVLDIGNVSQFPINGTMTISFNCTSIVPITSEVRLPNYTKGIVIITGGDAVLMAVDISCNHYIAFRNNGAWINGRKM